MEFALTASSQPAQPSRSTRIAIVTVATVAVSALVLAAITFFGLAVGFEIALPIADQLHIPVKPSDLEIARQFAGIWWVFAVASIVTFFAAIVTAVKVIQHVSPPPAE
jgi:hypothetical protein